MSELPSDGLPPKSRFRASTRVPKGWWLYLLLLVFALLTG